MESVVDDLSLHYAEQGTGSPLVALHGAGVDHREIEAAMEAVVPLDRLRLICPDLPGMGRTPAHPALTSNDDVVGLLSDFIEQSAGGPALLLGHSYGAYVARGIAARRPDLVRGLALLCPIGHRTGEVPPPSVVRSDARAYAELAPELRSGFDDYFVVRTQETARRYRDHIAPAVARADQDGLGRIFRNWRIDLGSTRFDKTTVIIAGRRDSTAGYASAIELLESYPQATLAVIEDAGHALPHEQPGLLSALLGDWIDRADVR